MFIEKIEVVGVRPHRGRISSLRIFLAPHSERHCEGGTTEAIHPNNLNSTSEYSWLISLDIVVPVVSAEVKFRRQSFKPYSAFF